MLQSRKQGRRDQPTSNYGESEAKGRGEIGLGGEIKPGPAAPPPDERQGSQDLQTLNYPRGRVAHSSSTEYDTTNAPSSYSHQPTLGTYSQASIHTPSSQSTQNETRANDSSTAYSRDHDSYSGERQTTGHRTTGEQTAVTSGGSSTDWIWSQSHGKYYRVLYKSDGSMEYIWYNKP
ncbi:uncharacterized protein BDR25DRAFT_310508 [Lindgomyces ingoldianus]|uniref:Uncharacterized protein n=1 Tax=Lindgomyces ingoldianus TaxID=673940 RepID=A0ACB6RAF0_9PLEO|nr:uncharacterized protein BDR25DRAFT_310508 [Lindgomyces ingoldianus]KAF2476126.1 hypothetical protein BDR25DRAFT_310508 [Lindgomyces ingoldianus]